jgi:hypothetical protein
MQNANTSNQPLSERSKGGKNLTPRRLPAVVPVDPEIRAALAFVEFSGPDRGDGLCRFEFNAGPEVKPLMRLLWLEDEPSVTYFRHGVPARYRWSVSAARWRRVYLAHQKTPYAGKVWAKHADLHSPVRP